MNTPYTFAPPNKSTTVRIEKLIRAFAKVSIPATGWLAERLFLTPPHYRPPKLEKDFLATGHRFEVSDNGQRIAAWSWGDGPTVYLAHGWGGRGGQLYPFVTPLLEAGFSVILYDVTAHGETPGTRASVVDFARTLETMVRATGPAVGVIAHSMGAAGAVMAMQNGLRIDRLVFVAPPLSPMEFSEKFAHRFGLSEAVRSSVQERIEQRFKIPFSQLDIALHARRMSTPLLVIHDENDNDVPLARAATLASAWPGAELMTTKGLGHRRILKATEVIDRAVSFFAKNTKEVPENLTA